jgi:hypothetical protein
MSAGVKKGMSLVEFAALFAVHNVKLLFQTKSTLSSDRIEWSVSIN